MPRDEDSQSTLSSDEQEARDRTRKKPRRDHQDDITSPKPADRAYQHEKKHSSSSSSFAVAKTTSKSTTIDHVETSDHYDSDDDDDDDDTVTRAERSSDVGCRSCDLYKILGRIGQGTYGFVYEAECRKTKRRVALKKLKLELESEGFPITSIRESITLLKGKHPNVIEVIEIVFGDRLDQIYIVMEHMKQDLKTVMHEMARPFHMSEIKLLMKQLLSGVNHLHNNWILHRDIKPSNLLIDKHRGVLKLGDFGLAREYGSPLKQYTNNVVTLWYRAIELLLSAGKYSTPIDVWSIGCIFGELLTCKPLWPGNSEKEQIELIFKTLGSPDDDTWPDYERVRLDSKLKFGHFPKNDLRKRLTDRKILTKTGTQFWHKLLSYDPGVKKANQNGEYIRKPRYRLTCQEALDHEFFTEEPQAIEPNRFMKDGHGYN